MHRILVTGSGGFVGQYARREFLDAGINVAGLGRTKKKNVDVICDLNDKERIRHVIETVEPNVIIHAAKISKSADYCEDHKNETYKDNVIATLNLIKCIKDKPIKFIFISSDYIYDGIQGHFNEESIPNPINYYGITKLIGEEMTRVLDDYLILRPTVIFGWNGDGMNFFMQLWRKMHDKEVFEVPSDQISNPTYVRDLTCMMRLAIEKDIRGAYMCTGPESMSRYEFAKKICSAFNLDASLLHPVETRLALQAARRPLNCSTDSGKLQAVLHYKMRTADEALAHMRENVNGR